MSGSQEAGKLLERTEREVRLILINRGVYRILSWRGEGGDWVDLEYQGVR